MRLGVVLRSQPLFIYGAQLLKNMLIVENCNFF